FFFFFFQAEDGIRDLYVTGVQTCALPIWGFPPEFAILFGTAMAALLGLVTGLLAIRRQGIYFAMITLALAQMVYFYYLQALWTRSEERRVGKECRTRGRVEH